MRNWLEMHLKGLYEHPTEDGMVAICYKVYGGRVKYWRERAEARTTPFAECCRQLTKETASALSKNLKTTYAIDIVCFDCRSGCTLAGALDPWGCPWDSSLAWIHVGERGAVCMCTFR